MTNRPASWRMPSRTEMEKIAAAGGRKTPPVRGLAPDDDLPAEYWRALLDDPHADVGRPDPGASGRLQRISQIPRHLRCRRYRRRWSRRTLRPSGPSFSAASIGLKGQTRAAAIVGARSIELLAASTNCCTRGKSSDAYADLRCRVVAFLAAVSLAGFLPAIGTSISFWPAAVFRLLGRLLEDASGSQMRT